MTEISQESNQYESETLGQMVGELPEHLHEWFDPNPGQTAFKLKLGEAIDLREELEWKSKITPEELLQVKRLDHFEQEYRSIIDDISASAAISHHQPDNFPKFQLGLVADYRTSEYQNLHLMENNTEKDLRALALTIATLKDTYKAGQPDGVTELQLSQKIAILRAVSAIKTDDNRGLIEVLRSGMGKTDIITPCILPTALLYRDHWDALSLTPLSRQHNFDRFVPIAQKLGITVGQVIPEGYLLGQVDTPIGKMDKYNLDYDDHLKLGQLQKQVTFAIAGDIAHLVQKHPDIITNANYHFGKSGVIFDEIDAAYIDNKEAYVISGEHIPLGKFIADTWPTQEFLQTLKVVPHDFPPVNQLTTEGRQFMEKLDGQKMSPEQKFRRLVQMRMLEDTKFQNFIKSANLSDHSQMKIFFLRSIMMMSGRLHRLQQQAQGDRKKMIFDAQGNLTKVGEIEIHTLLYEYIMDTKIEPDQPRKPLPKVWHNFFEQLLPPQIMQAVNAAYHIQEGQNYFVRRGQIVAKDAHMGHPKLLSKYNRWKNLALYAKEAHRHPGVKLPKIVQTTKDSMRTMELVALKYDKLIGLTGTGIKPADFFRKVYRLNTTLIPPAFPDRLVHEPLIACRSRNEKINLITDDISAHTRDRGLLISVSNATDYYLLAQKLNQAFIKSQGLYNNKELSIQFLTAENSTQAKKIFSEAGKESTISVVLLMAGREVDIPAIDGLDVWGTSPHQASWNDEQEDLRTARKGQYGTCRRYTCPEDFVFEKLTLTEIKHLASDFKIYHLLNRRREEIEFWRYITIKQNGQLSTEQQIRYQRDLQVADARLDQIRNKIQHWIDISQQRFENQLYESIEYADDLYRPLVVIRKRLSQLSHTYKPMYDQIQEIWPDFQTTIETGIAALPLQTSLVQMGKDRLIRIWQSKVMELYDELTKLNPQDKEQFHQQAYLLLQKFGSNLDSTKPLNPPPKPLTEEEQYIVEMRRVSGERLTPPPIPDKKRRHRLRTKNRSRA